MLGRVECSKGRGKSTDIDEDDAAAGINSDDAEASTVIEADDDDEDDGTEWKTDMSSEAVARRQREQLTSAAASLIQGPAVRCLTILLSFVSFHPVANSVVQSGICHNTISLRESIFSEADMGCSADFHLCTLQNLPCYHIRLARVSGLLLCLACSPSSGLVRLLRIETFDNLLRIETFDNMSMHAGACCD
jgi:hypothetical protein